MPSTTQSFALLQQALSVVTLIQLIVQGEVVKKFFILTFSPASSPQQVVGAISPPRFQLLGVQLVAVEMQ